MHFPYSLSDPYFLQVVKGRCIFHPAVSRIIKSGTNDLTQLVESDLIGSDAARTSMSTLQTRFSLSPWRPAYLSLWVLASLRDPIGGILVIKEPLPPPSPCPSEALISVYIGQGGGERPSVNEVFLEYNMGCGLYQWFYMGLLWHLSLYP